VLVLFSEYFKYYDLFTEFNNTLRSLSLWEK